MVPLRPLLSSKQSSSLRWLRQCSPALFPENKFSGPSPCSRGLRCSKNFLFKEIFKGCCLLFSYQGSCHSFFATALIFYQSSFALSRTFYFSFLSSPLPSRSASSDILYRLSHQLSVVNNFFHLFFQRFQLPFSAPRTPVVPPPRLRQCLTSAVSRCCPQRQVLSYHLKKELSMFFLFFIYFRQFTQF